MDKKEARETLEIRNFLSIEHIKWETGHFNIITGNMGSGKSLCIKLLNFFEDIIPNLMVMPYDIFRKNLDAKQYFSLLINGFSNIFIWQTSNSKRRPPFRIDYEFSYKEQTFSMTIKGKDEKDISFESLYLENLLKEWNEYLQKKGIFNLGKVTSDGFSKEKNSLHSDLRQKFGGHFPIATTFIPASRAALAFGSSHTDPYLKSYKDLVDILPQFKGSNQEMIKPILKARIKIKNSFFFLESDDGIKIPVANASSGQQEIISVLMLLDKLENFHYTYGNEQSLFIEEPEAHLFPLEQKQTIELIVEMFNLFKGNGSPVRFFITTHSPYILNALNNMLEKGMLLQKYKEQEDRINKTVDIPPLYANEISAYFLDGKGRWDNMLDRDEKYLNTDKIAKISYDIDKVSTDLSELKNELYSEKEERD
jgi:predicted ATPase